MSFFPAVTASPSDPRVPSDGSAGSDGSVRSVGSVEPDGSVESVESVGSVESVIDDPHDTPHPAAHHLGDEPALTGDHLHSTVHRLGRVSTTGGFDLPGEFDLPPDEPVVLVGDVPWELRDADDD